VAPLIALSGFMGSGKSTVGSVLAKQLALPFLDLDVALEAKLGMDIASYFQEKGESAFRAMELEAVADVLAGETKDGLVLALGGGTLDDPRSRASISERFVVANLRVGADEAWERVAQSDRPLARDKASFAELAALRERIYEDSADWVVATEQRDVDDIVSDLQMLVSDGCHKPPRRWARRLGGTTRESIVIGGIDALDLVTRRVGGLVEHGGSLRVFTDENVLESQGDVLIEKLGVDRDRDLFVMPPGEKSKSASQLQRCWEWLAERKTTRDDVVVAFGGGVVGDLAGFAAATYHRGIGLWQVPTSLLAQVDSSVGGKTAINLTSGKNLVGAFHQPDLVLVDPSTLLTLSEVEFVGAFGEIIKHALLDSEESLASLEASVAEIVRREAEALSLLVKRNIWYKASVVEEDEKEAGKRAVLNLGHTTAHALERALGYGAMSHGRAVALGLLVALRVSEEMLGLSSDVRVRTRAVMEKVGLDTSVRVPDMEVVMAATALDKKQRSGSSGFVGLSDIGVPVWGVDVPTELLKTALGVIAA